MKLCTFIGTKSLGPCSPMMNLLQLGGGGKGLLGFLLMYREDEAPLKQPRPGTAEDAIQERGSERFPAFETKITERERYTSPHKT